MKFPLILAAMIITGCQTTTSNPSFNHTQVPVKLAEIGANKPHATVKVMRDSEVFGMAMSTYLLVNGQEVATINNGDSTSFELEPGEHFIGIRSLGHDAWKELASFGFARPVRVVEKPVEVIAGRTYFYRITMNSVNEWEINRTSR